MRPEESFVEQPVRSLQTMLRVIAEDDPRLPTLIPDGIYGPSTMIAVTAFQRDHGLSVDGAAGKQTQALLFDPSLDLTPAPTSTPAPTATPAPLPTATAKPTATPTAVPTAQPTPELYIPIDDSVG